MTAHLSVTICIKSAQIARLRLTKRRSVNRLYTAFNILATRSKSSQRSIPDRNLAGTPAHQTISRVIITV